MHLLRHRGGAPERGSLAGGGLDLALAGDDDESESLIRAGGSVCTFGGGTGAGLHGDVR